MSGFLSERIKIIKIKDHTAVGTSAVTSDAIDRQGWGGVFMFTSFGTANANNTIEAQTSSDDGVADAYTALKDTKVASGSSDEDVWIDVLRPPERYLKMVSARGTSSTQESGWAILYDPDTVAQSNVTSGTIVGEQHVAPAEGTA